MYKNIRYNVDYLAIIKFLSLKLSAASAVGLLLLLYIKPKLNDKADKTDLNGKADKKDIDTLKQDLFVLKDELIKVLKEKLEASSEIMSITVNRLEAVFNAQNSKIKGIVDVQIKALNEHLNRLEKRQE